ncbi:sugar ABC transporter ATP-binding protein [Rhodobacter sp. HX-7-19]|uniref:Sugar ABC transporter ATP-binding protein n=1 Tax=Paragemmobacter kunshanensis TaxID=2583234 RepID=A0A6M1U1R3_9RHOB|nr:sugar ABC transporter ATP-binding protein [Rhodobacter kunshanensis]NGQ91384.1 sugar ABC transporter ATP-binding protein [Rhodobacter kunshanensis]
MTETGVAGAAPVLEARGIVKIFGQHRALDGVDFAAHGGEVHALLGENGAGKSTLIKILTGAYQPDGGELLLEGAPIHLRDPLQGQGFGIGTVYQEVNLLPNRSVAENLFLGRQPTRFGLIDRRSSEAQAAGLLARYGLEIDVRAELSEYSVAVQQIVAIARAVELSGKVLVLDEPTASLDRNEVLRLFEVVRGLKARGLAIIFITHFLDQVFDLADRVTILRNGRKVATQPLAALNATDVVRMMLGKDVAFDHQGSALAGAAKGAVRVEFRGMGRKGMAPFDLAVHEGEVVRVAGLLGSGRTEVARLMFGVDAAEGGEVLVDGRPVAIRNPAEAVAAGFGFCPEDRKIDGIFGDLSVRENIIIALQAKLGWFKALNRDDQVELAGRYAEALDIRAADHDMPVKLLSGGNQQKVILARWLAIDPTFLILDEPTRGIDVGAHAEIVRTINRLREEGLALFVISSELDEVVAYSNRIVVMRDREMVAELDGQDIAPDAIVQAIAGTQGTRP